MKIRGPDDKSIVQHVLKEGHGHLPTKRCYRADPYVFVSRHRRINLLMHSSSSLSTTRHTFFIIHYRPLFLHKLQDGIINALYSVTAQLTTSSHELQINIGIYICMQTSSTLTYTYMHSCVCISYTVNIRLSAHLGHFRSKKFPQFFFSPLS